MYEPYIPMQNLTFILLCIIVFSSSGHNQASVR